MEKRLDEFFGVKFCQNTVLLKSFLDHHEVPYEESELEMTPLGLGLVTKHDEKENL
jgi:hypothetical protein